MRPIAYQSPGQPRLRHYRASLRRPGRALAVAALLAAALLATSDAAGGQSLFTDVAAEVGLDFFYFNGASGELYYPEVMGAGAALIDYDNDGDLDAYLVQGALLGAGKTLADATVPPPDGRPPRDRLYRNDPVPGGAGFRFVDVTEAAGIEAPGYGVGVAAGDYDGDGWTDLYVTNYGPNQLLHNNGDGTFTDVTAASGTDDPRWSVSAAFLDYDGDGWLDLFVANYVVFSVEHNPRCFTPSSRRDYCGPSDFPPEPDRLLRNRGDGTFEDVSLPSRIGRQPGAGLGVTAADFDGDGLTDIYVANDGMVNFLWLNQGDGTFQDEALLAGVAVNREGEPEASMGVDAADFDGDGDEDLFMTHLMGETNTLYVNDGGGLFEDRTIAVGLGPGSLPYTSFGTAWVDYDNDGWLDLLILNGSVIILEELARSGDPFPLGQPNQLFHNVGGRKFEEVTAQAGEVFQLAEASRGAAFGDVDGDGDTDVLVANNGGPARLLLNRVGQAQPWLGLRLDRRILGSPAVGARARLLRPGAPPLWRRVRQDGSFCAANDPRILAGLGAGPAPQAVEIHWGRRRVLRLHDPADRRYVLLFEALSGAEGTGGHWP